MYGLPGDWKKLNQDLICCENHADRKATWRLQGETDSFGAEYDYYCDECRSNMSKQENFWYEGTCDRCGQDKPLYPYRDPDEGFHGPVYSACKECRVQILNEMAEYYE